MGKEGMDAFAGHAAAEFGRVNDAKANEAEELGGLDDGDDETAILIATKNSDDEEQTKFELPLKYAIMSILVKNQKEGDQQTNDDGKHVFKLSKVDGKTLKHVVEYLTDVAKGEPQPEISKPIKSVKMTKIATNEAAEFIGEDFEKFNKRQIFEIILAANYMDIKGLLHLGCAKIATLIKGKSPEEIKRILGDDGPKETSPSRRLLEALNSF